MLPNRKVLALILGIIISGNDGLTFPTIDFHLSEIPEFIQKEEKGSSILEMDYASYHIKNPSHWNNSNHTKQVYKVDIVFTKYPYHKEDWITPYDSLLFNRIRAIGQIEPSVLSNDVEWHLILQTNCITETDAENLFHGVVLWYNEQAALIISDTKIESKKTKEEIPSSDIDELMSGNYQFTDSTVFKVLQRNSEWHNMLIVNDWTASMYHYGAQTVLWHKNTLEQKRVANFVFFNDGDNKKHKPIGKSGGIYFASPDNIEHVVSIMKKVQRKGDGGDSPENNIEALLKAVDKTKNFSEVILIADNRSAVKDISLLKALKVPVRVVICGIRKGQTIRHDYLQIASATGGSVHTIEEDIMNLSEMKEGERITIMNIDYQRARGRIVKAKQSLRAQL